MTGGTEIPEGLTRVMVLPVPGILLRNSTVRRPIHTRAGRAGLTDIPNSPKAAQLIRVPVTEHNRSIRAGRLIRVVPALGMARHNSRRGIPLSGERLLMSRMHRLNPASRRRQPLPSNSFPLLPLAPCRMAVVWGVPVVITGHPNWVRQRQAGKWLNLLLRLRHKAAVTVLPDREPTPPEIAVIHSQQPVIHPVTEHPHPDIDKPNDKKTPR